MTSMSEGFGHLPRIAECPHCGEQLLVVVTKREAAAATPSLDSLATFFHEEYWSAANEPHLPHDQAESTDCEVCWSSATKLAARLDESEPA